MDISSQEIVRFFVQKINCTTNELSAFYSLCSMQLWYNFKTDLLVVSLIIKIMVGRYKHRFLLIFSLVSKQFCFNWCIITINGNLKKNNDTQFF